MDTTHHLVYSGLLSWRLGDGVWKLVLKVEGQFLENTILVKP